MMKKIFLKPVTIAVVLSGLFWMNSCSTDHHKSAGLEFMPDMYRSPSYETYQPNPMFKDSLSARLPVAGTIPRGFNTYFPYPNTAEGYEASAAFASSIAANAQNLAEGDRLFHIYCQHCHGEKGDGQGSLKIKGEKFPVPSYFDDAHINIPEGKMFFSVTYGKNLMGSHASQIDPDQRWQIISYIKSLQAQALAAKSNTTVAPADSATAMKK